MARSFRALSALTIMVQSSPIDSRHAPFRWEEMWRAGFIPFASPPNFFLYHVTKPHSAIVHQRVLITVAILMLRFSGNGRSRGSALQLGGFHFGLAHFVVFFPLGGVFCVEGER